MLFLFFFLRTVFILTILQLSFLNTSLLFAESSQNPLSQIDGLEIRLVPKATEPINGVGIKAIEVRQSGSEIQLKWNSIVRVQTVSSSWPTYRMTQKRGVLTTTLSETYSLSLPHLWVEGFVNLNLNGTLWIPSSLLLAENSGKVYSIDPSLLKSSSPLFKNGPSALVQKIEEFRDLVQAIQLLNQTEGTDKALPKPERKILIDFINGLNQIRVLQKGGTTPLVVNGKKREVSTVIIGNSYIRYVVLDDPKNPLILNLDFKPEGVPERFQGIFSFFHDFLEYQITQIRTAG